MFWYSYLHKRQFQTPDSIAYELADFCNRPVQSLNRASSPLDGVTVRVSIDI